MESSSKKIEIYYDHYKSTFQHQLQYIKNRNKYFLISLALITAVLTLMSNPKMMSGAFNGWLGQKIGEGILIDFHYINSFLLFTLLWTLVLYFQANLTVEKHFKYIHILEKELSKLIHPLEITREGKFYFEKRPFLSMIISTIYKLLFPIVIIMAICTKIKLEYDNIETYNSFFDIVICMVIILLTLFYIFWRNKIRGKDVLRKNKTSTIASKS